MARQGEPPPPRPAHVEALNVPALAADRDRLLSRFILAMVLDEPRWKTRARRPSRLP